MSVAMADRWRLYCPANAFRMGLRSKEEVTRRVEDCMTACCPIPWQSSVLAISPKMCRFRCRFSPYGAQCDGRAHLRCAGGRRCRARDRRSDSVSAPEATQANMPNLSKRPRRSHVSWGMAAARNSWRRQSDARELRSFVTPRGLRRTERAREDHIFCGVCF
jgi:hypothetical protein